MINHKIRLVYSASTSKKAMDERSEWGLENARQLNLFDDVERIRILFVPIADITARYFIRALDEKEPYLVLDTRAFPDFFSVFPSIESALDEFNRRGIKYDRVPIQINSSDEPLWKQFASIKTIFSSYLEKKTVAPVFILSSTKRNLNMIADRLKGYIKQEIFEAKFEEVNF